MPSEEWPQDGDLRLQKVEMRYRANLPLVLKGITCHIKPKEKIGIVGRTGSGKKSISHEDNTVADKFTRVLYHFQESSISGLHFL